jgi:pimeloyl-ACP methyl ester carboxylesterase
MDLKVSSKIKFFLTAGLSLSILLVNAQTKRVKANGIRIAYELFGKASDPKIILINGTGAPMTDWPIEFCEKLAKRGYEVIRFDNRDVGLSTKLDSLGAPNWAAIAPFVKTCKPAPLPYTLMDMANDVIGLMDALKIQKAHIVGASMGGAIAQLVAINYPARTLTLTTLSASSGDPNLPAPEPEAIKAMSTPPPVSKNPDTLANYLVNVYKALGSTDDELTLRKRALAQVKRSWYPEGTSRQVAAILIGDNCDRRNELAKITAPTMVIHGDSDPLVNLEAAKEISAAVPNAELHIIKGMGHDFSESFVDTLVTLVSENTGKVK